MFWYKQDYKEIINFEFNRDYITNEYKLYLYFVIIIILYWNDI